MKIAYRFLLKGGQERRFELNLDPQTLSFVPAAGEPPPEWTRLSNRQCPHCPLGEDRHPQCPIARNLAGVIGEFAQSISFEEAEISIATEAREYRHRAPLQSGISSLIGLVMVTSGCPHLDKLRPMVYTHLPFSSTEAWVSITMLPSILSISVSALFLSSLNLFRLRALSSSLSVT